MAAGAKGKLARVALTQVQDRVFAAEDSQEKAQVIGGGRVEASQQAAAVVADALAAQGKTHYW
jgi:hypothetical protein